MAVSPVQEPGPRVRALSLAAVEALRAENRAAAARLRACRKLYVLCEDEQFDRAVAAGYGPGADEEPSYAIIDPLDVACAELVAAHGIHHLRARALVTLANTLALRFPGLLEAMDSGLLDENTASLLARHMRTVDASLLDQVHRDVVAWLLGAIDAGRRPGREAILQQTDRIIAAHDPEGVLLRRERAFRERNVRLRRGVDGMADLTAHLSSTDAMAISQALDEVAYARKRESPANSDLGRLRADALVEALVGPSRATSVSSEPGDQSSPDGAGARGPLRSSIRPHITVLTPLGPDGEPEVYLPRGGPASIDALIALLARSVGATITLPDAAPGAADSPDQERRYRLSPELARRIRLRDGTCRHPGCSVPAEACDIDHCRPFNHTDPGSGGLSVESNLLCLCRRHHRFKTFHDWHYRLARDGILHITTDTGHTLTTEPTGPLARWRQNLPADAEPPPDAEPLLDAEPPPGPGRRPWLSPRPQSTHWLRRAERLAAERRANSVARDTPARPETEDDPPPF